MQEIRRQRLQSVIQEELSVLISREVKDPRVPSVTITQVEVTPDGEQATVYISVFRDTTIDDGAFRKVMKECLAGLGSAAGYLRRQLAPALNIRHVPTLIFKEDRGLDNALRVHELLKQISQGSSGSDDNKK